jgi:hypothetical protein
VSFGSGKALSVVKEEALTSQSQLDGTSRPAWFIPPDELPKPTPAPTAAIPAGSSVAESPGATTLEPGETGSSTEAP